MGGAKLGLNLQAPEALVQAGALVGDYAVKTEVATSDLKRTHRDGGSVVVVNAGALAYKADGQGNLQRADGSGPTSYTFDTEGNAINTGGAPSGSGVVTDNTIFGGEAGESVCARHCSPCQCRSRRYSLRGQYLAERRATRARS